MFECRLNPITPRSVLMALCLAGLTACGNGSADTTASTSGTANSATTAAAAPAAPDDLVATPGNAQTSLTWSASSGATSYDVKRSTTSGGPYSQLASATSPSYTDAAVTNGTTYFYVVTAVNAEGESGDSASASVTPDPTITTPAVPMGLTASAGNAQAELAWSASSGATTYHVKRATTSGGPYAQMAAPTAASYDDTALTNGTKYYYVVSALNSAGESANSAQVSASPVAPASVPAAPTGLTATAGNAKASLTWSASSGASGYHVKRATISGGPYTQVGTPTTDAYSDASVTNGTKYYYVVSAVDSAGESADSVQVSATPASPVTPVMIPATPTGLAATAGNAQVGLAWSSSSGATGYHVKRATSNGGPYSQVGAPTSTSYTDTALSNGTTYYYVVSALDSSGESTNSAQVSASPSAPATPPPTGGTPSGPGFTFTSAPAMSGVTMVQNRDSVIVQVPAVANARDFRVLVQPTGVSANADGTESVSGGTQFCAGIRQHQARTRFVADNVTLFPYYFFSSAGNDSPTDESPPNFYGPPPTPWSFFNLDTPPNLSIEVTGVTANMTVTVEALDRMCPFPGAIGRVHEDIRLSHGPDVDHPTNPWIDATSIVTFPIVTKDEVIARYGSLIINGQGWAGGPNVQANPPANPPFAQPAAASSPKVLARASLTIAPLSNPPAAPAGFFDDFSNASDTFTVQPIPKWTYPRYPSGGELVMQNSKWTFYANGFTCCSYTAPMDGAGYADAYVDNGALHTTLGDVGQDVLSEVTMIPRKAAHLNATSYLHITYEVDSFATNRRYWVVTLCGSSTPGQTLDSTGAIKEQIVHSVFFYLNTGMSPSTAGWNCLQILNRDGNQYAFGNWESMHNLDGSRPTVPPNKGLYDVADYIYNTIPSISEPTKTAAFTVHPESDVIVLVNKPIPKANLPEIGGTNDQVVQSAATSPINVSPLQLDNPGGEIAWFYKVDANGHPVAPILDDQQLVSPRTKYDLYVRNNRIIMYVNGKATLCNDFTTPTTTLNIADAAVGFHQVLYHSSGEFVERFVDPDRGAAYHYRYNSPWLDQRTWDNIGFEESVAAPADFNAATCFEHASLGPENNEP